MRIARIKSIVGIAGLLCINNHVQSNTEGLPNILWITSEDNSPYLGCYGDKTATTPNIDKLAQEGLLYTHAYANAPVSAPARNTIITGVYASSNGNEGMRSMYLKSDSVRTYTHYLKKKGYYCTNNSKGDYNASNIHNDIWDEMSNRAHYKNREHNQPFFAIFNLGMSHESSIHKSMRADQLKHDPLKIKLPPYHPENDTIRHDWAYYYDNISRMDSVVGAILQELEERGESENTIVFYYSDHGGVLGRSKRTLYETGTHVPLIVRIPPKYRYLCNDYAPGTSTNRLVSFVDLAPTLLSIIEEPKPAYMQGNAFLGKEKSRDPEYAYMFRARMDERFDMSRSVRNKQFRYMVNFMPYRPLLPHITFLWNAPSMQNWFNNYKKGNCNEVQSRYFQPRMTEELYLTANDPWEINNLVENPMYSEILKEMRTACFMWMKDIKDAGIILEPLKNELYGDVPLYDVVRQHDFLYDEMLESAYLSCMADSAQINQLLKLLQNKNPIISHWGAIGLLRLGRKAIGVKQEIIAQLHHPSETVSCVVAECLFNMGEEEKAISRFLSLLDSKSDLLRAYVLNSVDCLNIDSSLMQDKVNNLSKQKMGQYDGRMIDYLIRKWVN